MRAVVRCVLAVVTVAASVVADPAGTSVAAANQPHDFAIASVLPRRGETVGVAYPVVVTFTTPVTNRHAAERAIAVKSTPAMTGKFEWLDNNVVQWAPNHYWPANITDHTFKVSVDGVDATPPPTPHHRPHFGEEGMLPASMGRPEFPTPVGNYTVLSKDRSVLMDSSSVGIPVDDPNGYMLNVDYAVRITNRGLFVHSAPWAVQSLGLENVSHGCISLSPEDAEWYYNTVNIGDPVIVQE
jgi:lipoprotein-anchoring transpeptidase ErfK/SrfK